MAEQTVLDSAGFVDFDEVATPLVQSRPEQGIVHSHVRNGDLGSRTRRGITLRWQPCSYSTVRNILHHYNQYAHAPFDLQLPGGESVNVIYRGGPRVQRRSALSADVTVLVEETGIVTAETVESVLTNLPSFSAMTEVTTLNEGGQWQINDSFGDFRMGIVTVDSTTYYLIIWHYFGGVVARKTYDGDPYSGWPTNVIASPTQAIPRNETYSASNSDTWDFIQNPSTGIVTATTAVAPGALPGGGTGHVHCIQRATASNPTASPDDWTRYPSEIILQPHASAPWEGPTVEGTAYSGGILEQSVVYIPGTGFVIFYDGDVIESGNADFTGATRYRRMGRAVAPAATFDTSPAFSRTPSAGEGSYVWSQIENGMLPTEVYGEYEAAVWGTALVPRQSHVSRNPNDGLLHMVLLGSRPNVLIGQQNQSWAIGHYWSDDDGFTWTADVNNPLVTIDDVETAFGAPVTTADFLNSPNLFWDTTASKVYLAFAANNAGTGTPPQGVYSIGTKLMLMEAAI